MRKIYLITILLLTAFTTIHAQDCSGLKEGTFEAVTEGNAQKLRVERFGNYQLETAEGSGEVYLLKIIGTGCQYKLEFLKVIDAGKLPPPPIGMQVNVEVYRAEKNEYFFNCRVDGLDFNIEGHYTKTSDGISPEFKKILAGLK